MNKAAFEAAMSKFGVAYITHKLSPSLQKDAGNRTTTFVVGTTDFDDKYIKKIMEENTKTYGSPTIDVADDEVLIFSYSKNKFRKLKLSTITKVTSLNEALDFSRPLWKR